MTNGNLGVLIGAAFGLAFVVINAGELPSGIGLTMRILVVIAFLGLIGLLAGARRPATHLSTDTPQPAMFGRGFWMVVFAEVVIGWAGLIVVNGVLDSPDADVAWIALVVGLHFVGLAAIWQASSIGWLGAAIALCGMAGVLLAAPGASAATIAAIGGLAPGALLMGVSWLAVLYAPQRHELHSQAGGRQELA